jgi:DNA/RNA endonuclease YhcR with UshA esterase domain
MKKYLLIAAFAGLASLKISAQNITAQEASKHIGEKVTICGKIFGGRFFEKNEKTLLNMGAAYPDHTLTVVIEGADRKKFSTNPEEFYANKEVCITGEVRDFKGKPEMQVTEITQIVINEAKPK